MKPTVLIADDEKHVRKLLKMIVDTIHFELVAEASNGEEAISLFNQEKPDVMLLDINMPKITGDEILEELADDLDNTCTIMMTAIVDQESVEKCLKLGARNFIRKDTPVHKMAKSIKETWQTFEQEKPRDKFNLNQIMKEIGKDT